MKRSVQIPFLTFLVIFASTPFLYADSSLKLVKEWDVSVGPTSRANAFYRAAVCADGTYYLTDALGRVVALNAAGDVLDDAQLPETVSAIAVACDDSSRFLAAAKGVILLAAVDGNGRLKVN